MVFRWRCRHCDFCAWAQARERLAARVTRHMLEHNQKHVTEREFDVEWTCPYCDRTGQSYQDGGDLDTYGDHLFGHVEALVESGVHIADDFDRAGSVLVRTGLESSMARDARIHFTAPCDIVVIVTPRPSARIRLLTEELSELPAWIVVLTTNESPLDGLQPETVSELPLEVVQLDKQLGLSGLGETASRVLAEQNKMEGTISFEFDILSELIDVFQLQEVFKFVHLLNARLDNVDALSHYYIPQSSSYDGGVNVLAKVFDLQIRTEDDVFVSPPNTENS
jgi:hypothetical protein